MLHFINTMQEKRSSKKWLFIPVSLIVHFAILGVAIISPYLRAENQLPPVNITDVMLDVPPPAKPPAPPAGSQKKPKSSSVNKPKNKRPPKPARVMADRFVAPVEIPDKIEEDDLSDFAPVEGIAGGMELGDGISGIETAGIIPGGDELSGNNSSSTRVSKPARLIRRVKPVYPRAAIAARVQGVVLIEAVTDIYGRVRDAKVVSGHPLLNNSALQAIRQWIYEPFMINGIPKPVKFTVSITFSLNNR